MQRIEFSSRAMKFLQRLQEKSQKRILAAIYKLPQGDILPLEGKNGEYRLRVGGWRVIWEYRGELIFIMEIGNRGDVYK
ncbi:MAG: type II toxin-antitoxin system RelE/ParE family toxin [Oscillospiraceae bacterium]|nr:type II toxin-antitoxin system RelE/ParE family toxin [Oscillospiraceae bacterium]